MSIHFDKVPIDKVRRKAVMDYFDITEEVMEVSDEKDYKVSEEQDHTE